MLKRQTPRGSHHPSFVRVEGPALSAGQKLREEDIFSQPDFLSRLAQARRTTDHFICKSIFPNSSKKKHLQLGSLGEEPKGRSQKREELDAVLSGNSVPKSPDIKKKTREIMERVAINLKIVPSGHSETIPETAGETTLQKLLHSELCFLELSFSSLRPRQTKSTEHSRRV